MTITEFFLIEKYLKKIKKTLAYPAAERRSIVNDYRSFIHKNIKCGDKISSMSDLYNLYGSEINVTKDLMSMITDTERTRFSKEIILNKFILRTFSISFLIAAFLFLTIVFININNSKNRAEYECGDVSTSIMSLKEA